MRRTLAFYTARFFVAACPLMPASPPSTSTPSDRGATLVRRATDGAVLLTDGRRGAGWSEFSLQELHRSLTLEHPDSARHLLYRVGFEWGLQDMLQLNQRVREERGRQPGEDLWKLDAATALARWSAPLPAAGWGRWKFDRSAQASGVTLVELQDSAVASALSSPPVPSDPVCHLYAGLFAGVLSFYDRTELHAVETECAALGHAGCRFLVAPGPIVDRAETARRGGANHATILRAAAPPVPPPAPAKAAKIPWKK